MRFVIVTGMSGAGKSTALKILEDAGYFCVDNLPIPLLEKFAQFIVEGNSGSIQKVALGVDVRSGGGMEGVEKALEEIRLTGLEYEILFLDAEDEVLVKRYKETRRTHPLAGSGRVENGIREERRRLKYLKEHADYILDSSQLLTRELKAELDKIFVKNLGFKNLMITVLSFGLGKNLTSNTRSESDGIPYLNPKDRTVIIRFLKPRFFTKILSSSAFSSLVRSWLLSRI